LVSDILYSCNLFKNTAIFTKISNMSRLLLCLALVVIVFTARAQDPQKVAISTTGCTVEVYCLPGRFDVYDLEDGSTVYADDCEKENVTYGIYCIKLKKPITDLVAAEDSMVTILDFLKLDYGIVKGKGYDKGHKLNKDENTRGIFDTWEDTEDNKWKIRAWTNGQFICVLHMHSTKELPDKKTEVFLNGLRFPGMTEKKKKD
jgi:hypothetical protein